MNNTTHGLIEKFWKQSQNYALPGIMMAYINYLRDVSHSWKTNRFNPKEINRVLYHLLKKISDYPYINHDLVNIFNDIIISFTDQQTLDNNKEIELSLLLDKMKMF